MKHSIFCLLYLFVVHFNFALSLLPMNTSFKTVTQKQVSPNSLYAKDYALLIGNYQYNKTGAHDLWSNLKSVKEDITAVGDYLTSIGFHVTIKWNRTGKQLLEDYKSFGEKHSDKVDNKLLYYYAGHGTTISPLYGGDPQSYLVGVTAPKANTKFNRKLLKARSLSMDSFLPLAKAIDSKHALFVFDSCFSGNIFVQARGDNQNHIIEKLRHPVRYFITSGDEGELVDDSGDFRKMFLEGIQSKADLYKDGYVTASELGLYIQNEMGQFKDYQHPQHGPIKIRELSKGDFIFQTNVAIEPSMISDAHIENEEQSQYEEHTSNTEENTHVDEDIADDSNNSNDINDESSVQQSQSSPRTSIFDKIQFSFSFDESSSSNNTTYQNTIESPQTQLIDHHQQESSTPLVQIAPTHQISNNVQATTQGYSASAPPVVNNASPQPANSARSSSSIFNVNPSNNQQGSKPDFNQQFRKYHDSSQVTSRSQKSYSNIGSQVGSSSRNSRSSRSTKSTQYQMPKYKSNNGFRMNLKEMNPSRSRGGFQLMGSDGSRGNHSTGRGRPNHGYGGGGASGGGGQRGFHSGGGGGRGHGGGGGKRR